MYCVCTVYTSNIADPRNFIWIRIDEPIFKKLLTNLTLELFLSFSPLPELFLLFTSVYLRFIPPPLPPPYPRGNSENVYMKLGSPVPAGYVYIQNTPIQKEFCGAHNSPGIDGKIIHCQNTT